MDAESRFTVESELFARMGRRPQRCSGRLGRRLPPRSSSTPRAKWRAHSLRRTPGVASSCLGQSMTPLAWLPVEHVGLPVYDRERRFAGYRGFGICRDIERLAAQPAPSAPSAPPVPTERPVAEAITAHMTSGAANVLRFPGAEIARAGGHAGRAGGLSGDWTRPVGPTRRLPARTCRRRWKTIFAPSSSPQHRPNRRGLRVMAMPPATRKKHGRSSTGCR